MIGWACCEMSGCKHLESVEARSYHIADIHFVSTVCRQLRSPQGTKYLVVMQFLFAFPELSNTHIMEAICVYLNIDSKP